MRSLRGLLLTALPCAVALAFLPGPSFYYDIIPKAVALLIGAGLLSLWTAWNHEVPQVFWTSRAGRWNVILAVVAFFVTLATTLSSPNVSLAWAGSEWRRSGGLMQLGILASVFLASAMAARSVEDRLALLRGFCFAGVAAALYGIAQYFGWDPWIDSAGYHFGEGQYQIVRPPGPMGHSNYLAAFLLWPVFCGVALSPSRLGRISVLTGVIAIFLCGSRGAFAGLAAGALLLLVLERPRLRILVTGLAIAVIAAGAFYTSPYGERLRARVFWIGEDSAGGARLLLWRDSLQMSAQHLWTGFGPDTFAAEFPKFQSAELSRAFPDFYHESPHNLFLDALVGQGILGVLLWIGWIVLGVYAARRAMKGPNRNFAAPLLCGLLASIVAHQFAVLVIPTAFALLLGIGLLVSLDETTPNTQSVSPALFALPCLAAAGLFLFTAQQLMRADLALAKVQAADATSAGELWRATNGSAVSADLYFSRRWTTDAQRATTVLDKLRWAQLAGEAALSATRSPEQRQNAWYNLAILQAASNNAAGVEQSLRAAIVAAPTWYKPHWTLARLLAVTGRMGLAQSEARIALDLNGGHDVEVTATMGEILRSANPVK